jgi:selenocysteine-specific elongation factor
MLRYILGTAGHIDHGKTALVAALTGIDADRLPEEKARGITIDLGFAHLEEGDARIGFVDAPGHERFVRNMLAGAGGLDAILLVVAADEGVKPQTREHFAIARLLGVSGGLVALTKIDRVAPELLEVVSLEVREFVAGSFLEDAVILPVSARTGAGIPELRRALQELALAGTREREERPLRLPIDRAFSIAGFGSVVTGSLVSGTIAAEQRVEILPEGMEVRARRVEVHGKDVARAQAGERTSVNLAGVELPSLRRGQMLVTPGTLRASPRLLAQIELLPDSRPLKSGSTVTFHHFASETSARVRLLGRDALAPDSKGAALLALREPAALAVGDRFVLRRPSPPATIGGGVVLDAEPPRKLAPEDLEIFSSGSKTDRLRRRIAREPGGISLEDLSRREWLKPDEVRRHLELSRDSGVVELSGGRLYVSAARLADLASATREFVERDIRHRPGATSAPRAGVLEQIFSDFDPKLADAVLERVASGGSIELKGEEVRLPGAGALPAADQKLADRILARFEAAVLDPPSPADVATSLGGKQKIVEGLIAFLAKEKKLARLPGGFYISREAVDDVISRLKASGKKSFSVPEFKELFGLTRRMAIPLLEHLDERKITRRVGDRREVV